MILKSVYFDQCLCFPLSRGKNFLQALTDESNTSRNIMLMSSDFTFFPISIPKSLYFDMFPISFNGLEITIIYYHISNIFFVLVSLHSIMLVITGWKRVTLAVLVVSFSLLFYSRCLCKREQQ